MVEDEEDGEAGPELPPDFEEEGPDDEEGRFFGGGMEQKTAQAMEYIDQHEDEEAAVWNTWGNFEGCPVLTRPSSSPRTSILRGCAASH
jgi:hypothetical protein